MKTQRLSVKITSLVCVFMLAFTTVMFAGCGGNTSSTATADEATAVSPDNYAGKHHAVIDIESYGKITVELDGDVAPITVKNFITLANQKFYDGLTFHRIIKDFMMQGGDPLGNGTGGSANNIKGEFSSNGVKNALKHTRGAISMARSMDKDSASSQFFIVHKDSPHLDGEYAVFGYVTEGIEIVDQVCNNTPVLDGNGTVKDIYQPIINSIRIID